MVNNHRSSASFFSFSHTPDFGFSAALLQWGTNNPKQKPAAALPMRAQRGMRVIDPS